MDLLRKYFTPVFQVADMPVSAEPTADPTIAVEPAVPAEPPAPEKTIPVSVLVREVTPLRQKVREAEDRAVRAEREAADAKALAERLQANKQPETPAPVIPRAPSSDDDVTRRAAELNFERDAQLVSESGHKAYGPEWVEAVNALNAYGVNSVEFVGDVMDIDRGKAHEIMHAIAQDGEKAIALAAMPRARRIAEIARIAMASAPESKPVDPTPVKASAKGISRAPAPPPPVQSSASKTVDYRAADADKMSDAEWNAAYNADQPSREARARR